MKHHNLVPLKNVCPQKYNIFVEKIRKIHRKPRNMGYCNATESNAILDNPGNPTGDKFPTQSFGLRQKLFQSRTFYSFQQTGKLAYLYCLEADRISFSFYFSAPENALFLFFGVFIFRSKKTSAFSFLFFFRY